MGAYLAGRIRRSFFVEEKINFANKSMMRRRYRRPQMLIQGKQHHNSTNSFQQNTDSDREAGIPTIRPEIRVLALELVLVK